MSRFRSFRQLSSERGEVKLSFFIVLAVLIVIVKLYPATFYGFLHYSYSCLMGGISQIQKDPKHAGFIHPATGTPADSSAGGSGAPSSDSGAGGGSGAGGSSGGGSSGGKDQAAGGSNDAKVRHGKTVTTQALCPPGSNPATCGYVDWTKKGKR
jgi:hypothetical protein